MIATVGPVGAEVHAANVLKMVSEKIMRFILNLSINMLNGFAV